MACTKDLIDNSSCIRTLFITLTQECNLDCRYCFIEKKEGVIDKNTAKKAIDIFYSLSGKNKVFSFTGGEPLRYKEVLKELINYIKSAKKKYKKNVQIHITTNGTLLDEDFVDFCEKRGVLLRVSIDGEKSHDFNRKNKNYDYYYITEFIKKKVPKITELLVTVNSSTVYNLFEDYLSLKKLNCKAISIKPVINSVFWDDKSIIVYINQLKLILGDYLKELNKKTLKFDFQQLRIFLKNENFLKSINQNFYEAPCDTKALSLDINGDFYTCRFYALLKNKGEYKIGNVTKGLNLKKRREVLKKNCFNVDNNLFRKPCISLNIPSGKKKPIEEIRQMEKLSWLINTNLNKFHNYLLKKRNRNYFAHYLLPEIIQKKSAKNPQNNELYQRYYTKLQDHFKPEFIDKLYIS